MVLIFLSVVGLHNVWAQPTAQDIFKFKETFKYEVKYGFLKLGEVEVTMMPDTLFRGELHKHLITKITSNPKIPFIGTEIDHFNSLFIINDDGLPQTSYYWKDNIDEKISKDIEYDFDRINNFVAYKEEDLTKDTLELEEPATAGQIIFLFSRLFAGSGVDNSMIIYVTKKKGYIHLNNGNTLEKRNYRPWKEPIHAYLTSGYTENIDGPFGFSGEFRAWFLDDELRVPLEARVKVLFGNALIRIIDYTKTAL